MRILYAIFVLCVGALVVTALAAARHIRRHEKRRRATAEEEPAVERRGKGEVLAPATRVRGES